MTGNVVANSDQSRNWNGAGGTYWAAHADRYDRSVAAYQPSFLDAADALPGDRVLDVGCGNGLTARELARRTGSVLGIDLSEPMLAVARERAAAECVTGIAFLRADAQTHAFGPGAFDVVVSRHGSMFFDDPDAAFTNLARALRADGRLVLLVWQPLDTQEWLPAFAAALRFPPPGPDGPSPVSLGDPGRVRDLLGRNGFTDVDLTGLECPMWFGDDAGDAAGFVAGQFGGALEALDVDRRPAARADLHALMQAHETPDGVLFGSACWLVTARRAPG